MVKTNVPTDCDDQLVHTRQIDCRAYRKKNGLYEIRATVADEKAESVFFRSRPPVSPGEFIHRMSLTMVIDSDYTIRDVTAQTLQAPWPVCGETDAVYRELIGLRIGVGFSRKVRELVGDAHACAHITDLITQVANTYMQASWPDRVARQKAISPDPRHWPDKSTLTLINQCHTWRLDGETTLMEYPELVQENSGRQPRG